jgi:uncharacterized LabA/DUF88 family protein
MRIAVFVDAGYLYAQGSIAITKAKKPKPREELNLDVEKFLSKLKELTKDVAPNKGLLRIYWYDGALPGRLHKSHEELALTEDVKLRLGRLHEDGQQKGVDSLIVTDLIELARNRSITDALLISGDEDVRVGVEIAQTHGIRVHLLGIYPTIDSQSELLRREADTRREWNSAIVANFLKHEPRTKPGPPKAASPKGTAATADPAVTKATNPQSKSQAVPAIPVQEIVDRAIGALDSKLLAKARQCLAEGKQLPGQAVTLLYKAAEEILGRKPRPAESRLLRQALEEALSKIS